MITICTIGRTGSTLLMNTLNQFQEISICGEMYGHSFFHRIINEEEIYYQNLRGNGFKKEFLNTQLRNTSHPFHVTDDSVFYLCSRREINAMLLTLTTSKERLDLLLPQNKIRGCKLLTQADFILNMLESYVLKDMKFILLIRDAGQVMASMKRAKFKKYTIAKVIYQNKLYKEIHKQYPERTFLINYKDIVNNNNNFKDLFKFIGVKYNNKLTEQGLSILCSYGSQYHKYKNKRKLFKLDKEGKKKEIN